MLPASTSPLAPHHTIAHAMNKENVVLIRNGESVTAGPLKNLSNSHRRTRSRPAISSTPSPVYVAREAARDPRRRRTLSPPLVAQKQQQQRAMQTPVTVSLNVNVDDDMDVDVNLSSPAQTQTQTQTQTPAAQRTLQLPRHLKRPAFKDISPQALQALDPSLKEVALPYIRDSLELIGKGLLATASHTTASPARDHLPRELSVLVHDLSASLPTHAFAIFGKSSPRVALHPAHGLVLAAYCANLPPLPASKASSHGEPDASNTTVRTVLPVVPLRLPHPASFATLLQFLYSKRVDVLLAYLLPPLPSTGALPTVMPVPGAPVAAGGFIPQSRAQLSAYLGATFTLQALLTHTARVHGVWSNVVALGIFDDALWSAMEMCWAVLLGAVAKSTGAQWSMTPPTPATAQEAVQKV